MPNRAAWACSRRAPNELASGRKLNTEREMIRLVTSRVSIAAASTAMVAKLSQPRRSRPPLRAAVPYQRRLKVLWAMSSRNCRADKFMGEVAEPVVGQGGEQRVVRRRGSPRFVPPTVIGFDDWAWRRNQRYGTIICDLERRKTIALLPDRPSTAQAWLSTNLRSASSPAHAAAVCYRCSQGLATGDPGRRPLALDGELQPAFLDAVRKPMRQIRTAIGAATINPAPLTAAERIQYEGYLRREDTNAAILDLAKSGAAIKEIVRQTRYSRGLVRRVLRGQRSDVFRVRENSLDLHLPWLDAQWAAGHRNGTELWRQLKSQGSAAAFALSPSGPHAVEKRRRSMTVP
ncbi:MAG: Mobile element protein [Rhizobium sp.]|nr:Mobile element protein [Rhizobium sp.]